MERLHLRFLGRPIPPTMCSEIRAQLNLALARTPQRASLCCCITNEAEGFSANLKLHSPHGHLFIHRESKSLTQLMRFTLTSLRESLAQWQQAEGLANESLVTWLRECRSASHKRLPCLKAHQS